MVDLLVDVEKLLDVQARPCCYGLVDKNQAAPELHQAIHYARADFRLRFYGYYVVIHMKF